MSNHRDHDPIAISTNWVIHAAALILLAGVYTARCFWRRHRQSCINAPRVSQGPLLPALTATSMAYAGKAGRRLTIAAHRQLCGGTSVLYVLMNFLPPMLVSVARLFPPLRNTRTDGRPDCRHRGLCMETVRSPKRLRGAVLGLMRQPVVLGRCQHAPLYRRHDGATAGFGFVTLAMADVLLWPEHTFLYSSLRSQSTAVRNQDLRIYPREAAPIAPVIGRQSVQRFFNRCSARGWGDDRSFLATPSERHIAPKPRAGRFERVIKGLLHRPKPPQQRVYPDRSCSLYVCIPGLARPAF